MALVNPLEKNSYGEWNNESDGTRVNGWMVLRSDKTGAKFWE